MDFQTYQELARKTAIFPKTYATVYPTLGLIDECGEFLEKFLDQDGISSADVIDELGDVMWYVAAVCDTVHIMVDSVFAEATPIKDFYDPTKLFYTVARISGIVKKSIRDKDGFIDPALITPQLISLADQILTFLPNLETTIGAVMERNIAKLEDRKKRNVLKGSGDKR
jgi:NTP pyrophosphatase (non-canonical NTP hydrolase)